MSYVRILLKKGYRRRSLYLVLILLVGLITLLNWNNERNATGANSLLNQTELRIKDYNGYIKQNKQIASADSPAVTNLVQQRQYLQAMVKALKKGDEQTYLTNQIALLTWQKKHTPADQLVKIVSIPGMTNTIAKMLLLAQKQAQGQTGVELEGYEVRGSTFLYRTIQLYSPVILTAVIIFVLTPLVISPYFKRLDIERELPRPAAQKVLLRTGVSVTMGVACLLIFYFACFLVGTIRHGAGSFAYPIFVYSRDRYWLEPLWQVLAKILVLQIALIVAISASMQLIAQLTRNSFATLFLSLILIIGSYLLIDQTSASALTPLVPTYYLGPTGVVTGTFRALTKNSQISLPGGILVNTGYSCLVLLAVWYGERRGERA
ncbi:hypothetical protein [Lapidilactobacillus luobeiensis]|uniref:hypothetical protein n=1 Tax=Lapidilactobacillus luobeiensis TaxID=2950371 RepID=UPI0021C3D674|nr:hypothetical protein [Lapidilactobacillus luobeiensis]